MGWSFFLTIYGLIICFGGIYFRKFFSALLGFTWSAALSIVGLFFVALSKGDTSDGDFFIAIIIVIACTVLSGVFDRWCVALNSFLSSFLILLLFALAFSDEDTFYVWMFFCVIISLIPAWISFHIYNWAHIILTAFTGGFIASIGLYNITQNQEWNMYMQRIIGGDDSFLGPILIMTLAFGCLGVFVQYKRLVKITSIKSDEGDKPPKASLPNYGGDQIGMLQEGLSSLVTRMKEVFTKAFQIISAQKIHKEKFCISLSIIMFVILPLLDDYFLFESNPAEYNVIRVWVNQLNQSGQIIAIAGLIYLVFNRSVILSALYCFPCWLRGLLQYGSLDSQGYELIYLLIIFLLLRKFMKMDLKYILSVIITLIFYLLIDKLDMVEYGGIIIDRNEVIFSALFVLLTFCLVKIKENVNIFDIVGSINAKAGKQVIRNRTFVIILLLLSAVVLSAIMIKRKIDFDRTAAGRFSATDTGTDKSDDDSSTAELRAVLTDGAWTLSMVRDNLTDEDYYPGDVYSESYKRDAPLEFHNDDTFEWPFHNVSGVYSIEGNTITLYSDSTDEVFSMEYGEVETWAHPAMALKWVDTETHGLTVTNWGEGYAVYFLNDSFFLGE